MRISEFKMDSEREIGGVWCDVGDGLRILVGRMRNKKHKECLRDMFKPHLRQVRRGTVDQDILDGITRKATAQCILLGWENLEDENGNPIEYSVGKAEELLAEYPDFADIVTEFATDAELYRQENVEAGAKN